MVILPILGGYVNGYPHFFRKAHTVFSLHGAWFLHAYPFIKLAIISGLCYNQNTRLTPMAFVPVCRNMAVRALGFGVDRRDLCAFCKGGYYDEKILHDMDPMLHSCVIRLFFFTESFNQRRGTIFFNP